MPKITVLTITARNLYMEHQANSLKAQSFKDFEWVIVDANQPVNKLRIASYVMSAFPFTHIVDREKRDYYAGLQAFNWGLVHSRGELVFFMLDYVLPQPDCLKRHWEIYEKYKEVFISGRSFRVSCTPDIFDSVAGMVSARDYRLGSAPLENRVEIEKDLFLVENAISPTWWAGRNDSAPLEALLECNGFEEDLDGRWGGGDGEMANRLVTYGLLYLQDKKSMCLEFQHKTGDRPSIRSHDEQLALATNTVIDKKRKGIYKSNLKRDLREEREEWLKQSGQR